MTGFDGTPVPLCATSEQTAACVGLDDGADCGTDRRCYSRTYLPAGCGNGLRDIGEVCDDGNVRAADGCGPACTSDETCGNGVTDLARGEQCKERWRRALRLTLYNGPMPP